MSFWGTAAVYDGLGREVQSGSNQVLYAPDGGKLGLMSGTSPYAIDVPLPGGGAAVYDSGGLAYYRHPDWLGSGVVSSSPSRTLLSTTVYTPYGFDLTGAGAGYRSFTGAKQWTDSLHTGGQYDFLYREYSPEQGRWWTPDPAGLAAADLSNPQTLNRYNYAGGAPLENVDPQGLDFWLPCNDQDWEENPHCNPWGWIWAGEELLPLAGGSGSPGGGFIGGGADFQTPVKPNPPTQVRPPGAPGSGFGIKPLTGWAKFLTIAACVFGMDPDYARPITFPPAPPRDPTQSAPPVQGQGPPTGPNKTGKDVPYGGPREVPDGGAGGVALGAGAARCIANATTTPPQTGSGGGGGGH